MSYLVSLPDDADVAGRYPWVVSSLGGSFRPVVAGATPDVIVIAGRGPDWVTATSAAVASGVSAVVVAQPHPVAAEEVTQLAEQAGAAGTLVGVDLWFGSDPAWLAALPELAADAATAAVLDCSVRLRPVAGQDTERLRRALLAQVALVRPLLTADAGLVLRTSRAGGHYVITATGPGPAVCLSGAVCPGAGEQAEVILVGVERRWQIALHADAPSRPGTVTALDAAGSHSPRPHHEAGLRAGWRALPAALDGTGAVGYGLTDLAGDLAMLDTVTPTRW